MTTTQASGLAGKIREIRAKSPFPWRDVIHPNGLIQVLDANGKEVALFDIIGMVVATTNAMAEAKAA